MNTTTNHHHFVVQGDTKYSWEKAQMRAVHYYNELKKNGDKTVSYIASIFFKQLTSEGLYSIFRERYEEEFGEGRRNKPLPYFEGDFHTVLLLNPFTYKSAIEKKKVPVSEDKMREALSHLGPVCAMASIGKRPIQSLLHPTSGYDLDKLNRYAQSHWYLQNYMKEKSPLLPEGTEKLKLSRMQTPSKALDNYRELQPYGYRGLGFGQTLINTIMFACSIIFPEEKYIYLHARAGNLSSWPEGEIDPDWVVGFYEKIGAKWITSIDEYYAFDNDPYLNIPMRFSIEKNTGKLDHILLINDQ